MYTRYANFHHCNPYSILFYFFYLIIFSIKHQTHLVNETNEQNKYNENVQSDTVNESEKQSLTQKIESLKNDMDQKRLTIKNIKMSLEQLDVTE